MSVLPPTPTLDETIATGQHGHITDHEEIHRILNDLIDVIADPGPTIYIDATNGDDANDGKSVGTPKLTWAAALAALDDGTTIQGRIVAIGRFTITAPIVIGDGSKYVNLILDGFEAYSGSNSGLGACRITQSTNNTDIFQFAAPTSKSHSLIVRGIEVVGPGATSTGTAFNFAPGALRRGLRLRVIGCGWGATKHGDVATVPRAVMHDGRPAYFCRHTRTVVRRCDPGEHWAGRAD